MGDKMTNKVIQFPEKQSLRKRLMDRSQDRKATLGLSIASVLVLTVFFNEWMIQQRTAGLQNAGSVRGVASLDPAVLAKDIKWEHDLAGRLAAAELDQRAQLATKPSLRDELVFGYLQGKYGVRTVQGRIFEIEFLNAQAGDQPLLIEDRAEFLKNYSDILGKSFAKASLKQQADGVEVYTLTDVAQTIVGHVEVKLDHEGRMTHLSVIE